MCTSVLEVDSFVCLLWALDKNSVGMTGGWFPLNRLAYSEEIFEE